MAVFKKLAERPGPLGKEQELSLEARSPLWLVTRRPEINRLISDLQTVREQLLRFPQDEHELRFSRAELDAIRRSFSEVILNGERKLHQLCQLIGHRFLGSYALKSVVIGEVQESKERFTLTQSISTADLYSSTDLDLGNRQLSKLRFRCGDSWSSAELVANFVDYQPLTANSFSIHKIISRIKAEEEIWNKVADEIFDLDSIVLQDKSLRHLSRYVKDIFGLKIVVESQERVFKVQSALAGLELSDQELEAHQIPLEGHRRLTFLEVKNYLARAHRKRSGWEAMKSVVLWGDKTFEIQVQPLANFLQERELLTRESHAGFKAKREQVRDEIARQIPLFEYYRALLRWLFASGYGEPPVFAGVRVTLTD